MKTKELIFFKRQDPDIRLKIPNEADAIMKGGIDLCSRN